MKQQLQKLLTEALTTLVNNNVLESVPENIRIDHSKDKTQGDFASNIAMVLSKQAKCAPKVLAQKIVANFPDSTAVEKVDKLDIPLVVDLGVGHSWQEAH
ncbi:Arginyl-tRNA synthetase [uncultured Candidatus Thioglobus sp.]|nr:Arginyl-tRNA synthetase [uncultured Candidatus Thioglobus sp.]